MTATYDANLLADLDLVRFLVNDTDVDNAQVTDEEITATLTAELNAYLAAARVLGGFHLKWASLGSGVKEKMVDDLRIKYGADISISDMLKRHISELRARGAYLSTSRSRTFRTLGTR